MNDRVAKPAHADDPTVAAFAPGRVNLIGEHTDYNDGLALPFAIERGVTVRATAIAGELVEAHARDLGERDSFPLAGPMPTPGWRTYVRGAVAELRASGVPVRATRVEISGDLPIGSGLSSSAALEVALCKALIALADVDGPEALELAKLCGRIENDWAGSRGGLLDQLASLYGEPDHALRIDFRSLELRPVALRLGEPRLMTLDSGERHTNAASGYNERRAECARACELLGISSLRDAELAMAVKLPAPLAGRVRHVVSENQRVEQSVAAVERRDWQALGELLDSSHASLRDCYEVSTPAVESAVARLKQAGALGARVIGGGFGGHVLGLLPPGVRAPAGAVEVRPGAGARFV